MFKNCTLAGGKSCHRILLKEQRSSLQVYRNVYHHSYIKYNQQCCVHPSINFYLNFLGLAKLDAVLDNKEVVVLALRERERHKYVGCGVAATFFYYINTA
jgi:hypothetical protein